MKNLLICITGSVASILIKEIIDYALLTGLYNIKVILSKSSENFIDKKKIDEIMELLKIEIYNDDSEWNDWKDKKEVLHIELKKWADVLLICPLSANTLAKICCGICDNLITCTIKALDKSKPVFYALAMNTFMYLNEETQNYREKLNKQYGWYEIPVTNKKLKCGDTGKGALAHIKDIFKTIENELFINKKITFYFNKHKLNTNEENLSLKESDIFEENVKNN